MFDKYFKPKQRESFESDKKLFMEAINFTSVNEIPFEDDEVAVAKLNTDILNTKLYILGEVHGVKENVDIIYTLVKKFKFKQLGLEWNSKLKDVVEEFLKSGGIDFKKIKEEPDGRITAGHFVLIKRLKEEGLLEKVIYFDVGSGGGGWNARDASMAKSILDNLSDMPTLVIAGRLHSQIKPINFEDEKGEHYPMGQKIKEKIPNVPSGEIYYLSGQYHNYGTQEFENELKSKDSTGARFYLSEDGFYNFVLPEAHAATVPNPNKRI